VTESIGNLYSTKVPSLTEPADIREALRVYHYGASSTDYNINGTEISNLVQPSIAYHLSNLQSQISNFQSGVLPSAYISKGVLISASAPGVPRAITAAANGQILTTNSATTTGLEWRVPDITLTNTVTLINKTLTNATITADGLKFAGPSGNSFVTTLVLPTPTANRTILFPTTADMPSPNTILVGRDTFDTLTNKQLSVAQLTGTLPISSGGTGATTAANARSGIEIFNAQTTVTAGNDRSPYSGKIYVADPAIVGTAGASLDGAAQGDLWFW
jgi:hypothetical protein